MGYDKLSEAGKATQFSSTNQPPNAGRKPNKLKKYIKDNNLSMTDLVWIFQTIISQHTADEVKKMVETRKDDKGGPLNALVWGFLYAWLKDCQKGWTGGGINTIMLDRAYGKVQQEIKHTGNIQINFLNDFKDV